MTAKIDPKRELKQLYSARQAPEFVDVPELSFLMIDGHGDPVWQWRRGQVRVWRAVSPRGCAAAVMRAGIRP